MTIRIALPVIILIISCNTGNKNGQVSNKDLEELKTLHKNYQKYWLENDSTKVVNLFSEDGAIIPPGNNGDYITGRKAIGGWWFTKNADTTYPITVFNYVKDTLLESSDLPMWQGVAEFEWKTMVHDSVISEYSSVTNFFTICKKENGEWKIFRQIWNVRPAKK